MEDSDSKSIELLAIKLYANHIGISEGVAQEYLWKQCSSEYRRGWRIIAKCEYEDSLTGEQHANKR